MDGNLVFFVKVVGGNIRNNPPMKRWQVREDYRRMKNLGAILMFNEVGRHWYRAILRMVLGKRYKIVALYRSETPIAFKRKVFKKVGKRIVLQHKGKRKASPPRRTVILILRHRVTGLVFAVVCSHRVSGAWNFRDKVAKAWRKMVWNQHDEGEDELLQELYDSGISWVRFEDYNKIEVDPSVPDETFILGHRNIVKMSICSAPGGVQFTVVNKKKVDDGIHTDHPLLVAELRGLEGTIRA